MDDRNFDSVVEEFDFREAFLDPKAKRKDSPKVPVTFWIPVEYKAEYDLYQLDSSGRFGKKLKEVLLRAIDRTRELRRTQDSKAS